MLESEFQTTAIAALKCNGKYIGFETNPEYVELAERRISPHLNTLQLI